MIRDHVQAGMRIEKNELTALQRAFDELKLELDLRNRGSKADVAVAMLMSFMIVRSTDLAKQAGRNAFYAKASA